ncbi:hypothetical protein KFL_002650080 [Klebsormidium nitens]|uniref:RING-type domain-containing protein n=1 Tax=Klebsormidium nitens TaxID=105231 RepID=A0A1Y1IA58_KLENI|nr:hypothetical protein KFL_002650080 [Klebsormidium nitens]|eukprot:GAQ86011.1 hypothetical protein KFL_002650080 [Klebsormidium nitens]
MQDSTKHDSSAGFGKVNKEQESYTDLPAAALPLILPHLGGDLFFVAATSAVSRDWRIAATEELAQCRKLIVPECLAPAFSDEKLKQALKRMSPLGPSVLDLSECHRLTDMSMRQVILSLREVPEEISLRNCCTISWRGLKLLCRMLMALHRGELYQRQIANDERDDDSDGWKTPSLGDYDSDTPSERGGLFDSDTSSDGSGLEEVRRRRPWNRKRFQPMSVEVASDAKPSGEEANVLDDVSDLWHKVLAAEELPPGRRPLWFDQFIGWSSTQPQQPSIARDAAFAFSDDQPPTIMNLPDAAGLGSARWRLWRLKIAGVSFKECTLPKLQRYFMSMPLVWKLPDKWGVTFDCDRCKKFLCELEGDSVDAHFKCGHQFCDKCFEAHEDRAFMCSNCSVGLCPICDDESKLAERRRCTGDTCNRGFVCGTCLPAQFCKCENDGEGLPHVDGSAPKYLPLCKKCFKDKRPFESRTGEYKSYEDSYPHVFCTKCGLLKPTTEEPAEGQLSFPQVSSESVASWFLKDRRRPSVAAQKDHVPGKADEGETSTAKCLWQDESEEEFEEECQRQQDEAYEAYLRRHN